MSRPRITPLRLKRLLLLAQAPKWHKRFYSQYYYLIQAGLVNWTIGMASLTDRGEFLLDLMHTPIEKPGYHTGSYADLLIDLGEDS